jgi:hypothetical protein
LARQQLPTLITNPATDGAFVTVAEGLVAGGVDDPGELQRRLRERYPQAVVRPRELSSERRVVWYVYRDGHWTPGEEAEQPTMG